MYIGSTSIRGLHHLVYEIVDNAVDEALAGFCDVIDVKIQEDNSITVIDNGRYPCGNQPQSGDSGRGSCIHHPSCRRKVWRWRIQGIRGLHGVGICSKCTFRSGWKLRSTMKARSTVRDMNGEKPFIN